MNDNHTAYNADGASAYTESNSTLSSNRILYNSMSNKHGSCMSNRPYPMSQLAL